MVLVSISSIQAYAEDLTSEHVLAWKPASQEAYIQTSVTMAAIIASQNDTAKSSCIDSWYFQSEEKRDAADRELKGNLARYPKSHPGAIVLATIVKKCGVMKFTD